jgi:hypothetical protein
MSYIYEESCDEQDSSLTHASFAGVPVDDAEYDNSFLYVDTDKALNSSDGDEDLKPLELVWPLSLIYTSTQGKAFVYAMPSCFRVVCKNKKRVYTDAAGAKKFTLVRTKFRTYKAAKSYADDYTYSRFANKPDFVRKYELGSYAYDKPKSSSYTDTVYKVDWREYSYTRHSYPGDYLSDNVYWWNKGYIRAENHTRRCVPSWARY